MHSAEERLQNINTGEEFVESRYTCIVKDIVLFYVGPDSEFSEVCDISSLDIAFP